MTTEKSIIIRFLLSHILYLQQQLYVIQNETINIYITISDKFRRTKDFYTKKLGFEIDHYSPQSCVFKYNQGQASFAIRTPLEPLEEEKMGIGVALWFAVNENVEELKEKLPANRVATSGPIIETPFGRAFHVKDLDG